MKECHTYGVTISKWDSLFYLKPTGCSSLHGCRKRQKREQLPCSKVHKLGTRRLRSLKETQVNDSSMKRLFHPEMECSNSDQNRLMSPTVILIFLCVCISSGSAPI